MNDFSPVAVLSPPYANAYPTDQNAKPPPALSNKFHNSTVYRSDTVASGQFVRK